MRYHLILLLVLAKSIFFAQEKYQKSNSVSMPFTLDDKERLIRMEITLQTSVKQTNDRFDQMQTQINSIQNQINSLQNQINSRQNQINSLQNFLYLLAGMMITSVISIVGFILWDRRTFLKPFQHKTESIEEEFLNHKEEQKKLLNALRELAKTNNDIKTVLKQFHLL
ncbi:MAG: hypothetical protein N2203_07090 [Bacteroidia bacterium]|nr:hypothetical protein [Bacteroidia bacterium]